MDNSTYSRSLDSSGKENHATDNVAMGKLYSNLVGRKTEGVKANNGNYSTIEMPPGHGVSG